MRWCRSDRHRAHCGGAACSGNHKNELGRWHTIIMLPKRACSGQKGTGFGSVYRWKKRIRFDGIIHGEMIKIIDRKIAEFKCGMSTGDTSWCSAAIWSRHWWQMRCGNSRYCGYGNEDTPNCWAWRNFRGRCRKQNKQPDERWGEDRACRFCRWQFGLNRLAESPTGWNNSGCRLVIKLLPMVSLPPRRRRMRSLWERLLRLRINPQLTESCPPCWLSHYCRHLRLCSPV